MPAVEDCPPSPQRQAASVPRTGGLCAVNTITRYTYGRFAGRGRPGSRPRSSVEVWLFLGVSRVQLTPQASSGCLRATG
jgi:hypothetical protein